MEGKELEARGRKSKGVRKEREKKEEECSKRRTRVQWRGRKRGSA